MAGQRIDEVMSYVDLFDAGIIVEDDGDAAVEAETIDVADDQLIHEDVPGSSDEAAFGQYLVKSGAISPYELDEAKREQARQPGVRLSEIIAYMGYLGYRELDRLRGRAA
jgi:hypothetical protein